MSNFRILETKELLVLLKNYRYMQLHIHHTWKPAHSSFNGKNHISLQEGMKNFHINVNGWSDIGQHLTLMPDGLWVTGRPFDITPASIKGWNTGALAVEMLGNFDKPGTGVANNLGYDKLDGKQKQEILKLIKYFGERFGYNNIVFHHEGPDVSKTCPGTSLDKEKLIAEAKVLKESEEVKDIEDISPWAKEAMDWAIENKLVYQIDPKELINLERFITILHRFSKLKNEP